MIGTVASGSCGTPSAGLCFAIRRGGCALGAMLLVGTVSVASIRVRTEPAKDGGTSGVRVVASDAVEGVRAVARDRRSLLLVATMGLAMSSSGSSTC